MPGQLLTVKKSELLAMLAGVPDDAPVFILSSVQDLGRALAATCGACERGDPSEVLMAIEGPLAHDPATGRCMIVAGHLVR